MSEPFRLTATEARTRLAEGSLTARALVESCLARIAARDGDLAAVYRQTHLPSPNRLSSASLIASRTCSP